MKTETSPPVITTHSTSHKTTHSTSTRGPSSDEGDVVLITGGYGKNPNATLHSAEIFLPKTPGAPCILPDLPYRYYGHTQDGGMICGGYYRETQNTCRQWNSAEGKFPFKLVHEFKPGRYNLVSWTPVSEKETFLYGGGSNIASKTTITIVKPGIFEGIPARFNLTYPLNGACSIPDPDTDTVVITGGYQEEGLTFVYNKTGPVRPLGNLVHARYNHGCTSYVVDNKRV